MASKSVSSSSRPPANSTSLHVRRNLFHPQLSRRPTSASTSTSATTMQESPPDNNSEIVIRNQNGDPSVQIPLLPSIEDYQTPDDESTEKESRFDLSCIQEADYIAKLEYRDRGTLAGDVQRSQHTAWRTSWLVNSWRPNVLIVPLG
jgi:hypothetical protein